MFAILGGYLDAYSYLAHHRVFANAQTGNVVLFTVYASGGDWPAAIEHLPPIAAFVLGVATASLVEIRSQKSPFRSTLVCQAFEIAILFALAIAGGNVPGSLVVPTISFVAALQITSFRKVGSWSFNSAMTTGNLREATQAFVQSAFGPKNALDRAKAVALGSICLAFAAGALVGGVFTRFEPQLGLAPCVVLALLGFSLTWRQLKIVERHAATRSA